MWDNPFKGLAYFAQQDHASFGGRGRDVRTVASGILKSRTFVVYGRSGLGKTSLLLAGVFPELARHRCRTAYVRALVDPLEDLREALSRDLDGQPGDSLHAMIDRTDNDGPVVVVFDQFEEFFIRFSDQVATDTGESLALSSAERQVRRARRKELIDEIGQLAAASDLNLRLVFSLREDWVAEMHAFERAVPGIQEHSFRLMPMTSFGVRQSILQTLKAHRVTFDAGLVSHLVESLAEVEFDPAVLQVVASEVFDRGLERSTVGQVHLTEKDLEAVGGVWGIFRGYLEHIPEASRRRHLQIRAVLDSLITRQRTKRAVQKPFFLTRYFQITEDELDEVLEMLCAQRLAREDSRGGQEWYELIHERLVQTILDWLDGDREFPLFRSARLLVLNSCANPGWQENPGLLLTRDQLDDTVGPYRDLLRFTEEERLFLVSSAVYRGSSHVAFWAERAGLEVTAGVMESFFAQGEKEGGRSRRQAAAAACTLAPLWPELRDRFAGRCLELALGDPDDEVRGVAAKSFAHLARDEDFEQLARQLADRSTRPAAAEVLREVVAEDRLPEKRAFSRWQTWRAKRQVVRRDLAAAKEVLRTRAWRGARAGLTGGVIWALTAGPIFLWFSLFELVPGQWASQMKVLAVTLMVLGPLATWVGWRIARRAGLEAVRTGQEGRFFFAIASRRTWLVWLALTVLFLDFLRGDAPVWLRLLWLAWPLWLGGSALFAILARPSFWGCRRRVEALGWIWLWAFGGGMLLPMAAWAGDSRIDWLSLQAFYGVAVPVGLAAGLIIFVGCLVLAYSSPSWSSSVEPQLRLGELSARPRRVRQHLSRGAALALVAIVVALFAYSNGFDSFLVLAREIPLESRDETVEFAGGTVDTEWVNVWVDGQAPRPVWIRFPEEQLTVYGGGQELESRRVYLARPGSNRLALTSKTSQQQQVTVAFRPNLGPPPPPDGAGPPAGQEPRDPSGSSGTAQASSEADGTPPGGGAVSPQGSSIRRFFRTRTAGSSSGAVRAAEGDLLPEDAPRLFRVQLTADDGTSDGSASDRSPSQHSGTVWKGTLRSRLAKLAPENRLYLTVAATAQAAGDCPRSALTLALSSRREDFVAVDCEPSSEMQPLALLALDRDLPGIALKSLDVEIPIELVSESPLPSIVNPSFFIFLRARYSADRSQPRERGSEREARDKKQKLVDQRRRQARWSEVADLALQARLVELRQRAGSKGGALLTARAAQAYPQARSDLDAELAVAGTETRRLFFEQAKIYPDVEKRLSKIAEKQQLLGPYEERARRLRQFRDVEIPSLPLSEADRNRGLVKALNDELDSLDGEIAKAAGAVEAAEKDRAQLECWQQSSVLADLELRKLELELAAAGSGDDEWREIELGLESGAQRLLAELEGGGQPFDEALRPCLLHAEMADKLAKAESQLEALLE